MYTTDQEYEQKIQQRAREAIVRIEQRYKSQQLRIQELEWLRSLYKCFGCWQAAMDLVETQMVTWGRVEHSENAALVTHYDEEIRQNSPLWTKGDWDETDRHVLGLSLACAEARYAVRFLSIPDAILMLEARRQELSERQAEYNEYDRQKALGEADGLRDIISQLQQRSYNLPS